MKGGGGGRRKLGRAADFRRPTDAAYAFTLAPLSPVLPPVGEVQDIREVAVRALTAESAQRFEARIQRWAGPENERDGQRPYASPQLWFTEEGEVAQLTRAQAERCLQGTVLVLRRAGGGTDYVLRDHHTLDVALYHHVTRGELPRGMFHADRHSDWCQDSYLSARRPAQAATWWALLSGLKRPATDIPWLAEESVYFATAQAASRAPGARDIGAHALVPYWLDPAELGWEQTLERSGALEADWVSLDLDYFLPAPQLRLTRGLLRDRRFQALMQAARVRLFVLSPQFLAGGDRIGRWELVGGMGSPLRVLNLLRQPLPMKAEFPSE